MVKVLKKKLYKLLRKTILICMVIITILFENSINAKGAQINNIFSTLSSNHVYNKAKFIVDVPNKFYKDINKVEKVANMKFKVPDFLPQNSKVAGYEIKKLSDKDNAIVISFENSDGNFSLLISEGNPVETLKSLEDDRTKAIDNITVDSEKQPLKLNDVNGLEVTLITTLPSRQIGNNYSKESKKISKYFIWTNEGVWYSLEYNSVSKGEENSSVLVNLSQDDVIKIAKSLKCPEVVKNINYSENVDASTGGAAVNIYDEEDFEQAKTLLGFSPKFPLNIGNDIKITSSIVGVCEDSDTKNNKINYKLNNFYSTKNNGSIIFSAEKNSKNYDKINNIEVINCGDFEENKDKNKIKLEKLKINNIELLKCLSKGVVPKVNYSWKEEDIYYSVTFFVNVENTDELVKEFVNSKNI